MAKIGLVLSGGGANGFAHAGALKTLEKAGIKIDAVAGCSMGSIIGALYASGRTAREIEQIVLNHKVHALMDLSLSKLGIEKTGKLKKALNGFMGVAKFETLKIPLYVNATDLTEGKEVVFSSGEIFPAVRASIAIPGVFSPSISKDKGLFVDGGLVDNAPFHILPKKIKKYIIINVMEYTPLEKGKKHGLADILQNSARLAMEEILRLRLKDLLKKDYVLITPRIPDYKLIPGKEKTQEIIKSGEVATAKKINEIRRKFSL